jgi:hypothetical protein
MSNVRVLVKLSRSIPVAFVTGLFLAWLGVYLSGVLSAVSWPSFVVTMARESKILALYFWGVAVHFVPMFTFTFGAGLLLFRTVGRSYRALLASLVPYVALYWLLGSATWLTSLPGLATFGLLALGSLAFPLGLVVAWLLSRRRPLTPPSSGQPPAGFAV